MRPFSVVSNVSRSVCSWPAPRVGTRRPRAASLLALLLAVCGGLLLVSCGGGGEVARPAPFVVSVPGVGSPPPPGGGTPPPAPPLPPLWTEDAISLERTALYGSFPSDLVRHGRTLFAVDADQIEADGAQVRAFDIGGVQPVPSIDFADTTIRAEDLVDSLGRPVDLALPIGFGFYVNDIAVADDSLAFALVNAGGGDTLPTLSNLLVFDPVTGSVLQTINLAQRFTSAGLLLDSTGTPAPGNAFVQSGAEALAYVPGAQGNRLFVAMTNLIVGAPSYGAVKQRGTIQVFDVFPSTVDPVRPRQTPGLFTETLLTQGYNPVALHVHTLAASFPDPALDRLLVTLGGTTAYDASFKLVPVSDASVEVYDASSSIYEGRFLLGLAALAGTRPAIGRDAAGHLVGFFPSSVTGEIYLLRLDGIDRAVIDMDLLAVLRGPGSGLPVALVDAGGPGGNVTGCGLSPDGRSLVVSTFGDLFAYPNPKPGLLHVLALPPDVVTGSGFGPTFVPGTAIYGSTTGRTLGGLVLRPDASGRPDVFVLVGGSIDLATFLGDGPAAIGTLTTYGLIR